MTLISLSDLCEELDCSRATAYRWMGRENNPMPKPYKIGEGHNAKTRFKRSEIEDWLNKLKC